MRYVNVKCRKCGAELKLDVGSAETMSDVRSKMDSIKPFHCNAGLHMEFGSMGDYYQILDETIRIDSETVMTDVEWQTSIGSGPFYTTQELSKTFDIEGFMAPFCSGRRKDTGAKAVLSFGHAPSGERYYWEV